MMAASLGTAATVDRLLRSFGSDIAAEERAGSVRYHRDGKLFAVVRELASRCDVGFFKFGRARSKRILHARGRLPFVPYLVEVEAPGDLDTELRAWLRESYETRGEP